jgi:hypothetical protein
MVGIPRTYISVGGFSIKSEVQSPARETTREYPVFPGSGMVAKLCHSKRGDLEILV